MTADVADQTRATPVPRHARIDVIGGALMIGLAGLVRFGAIGLEAGTITNLGPGALPGMLALALGIAGAALLWRGLTQPAGTAEGFGFALRPVAIVVLAMVLFWLFIRGGQFGPVSTPQLGLAVVGPLVVFIAGCASPQPRWKDLVVLATGLTALLLLVFVDLLGVGIPVLPAIVQDAMAVRVVYGFYAALTAALYVGLFRLPGQQRD